MTAPLYALGRFCARHHYATIAAWVIVAAVLVVAGQRSEGQTNDNLTLPGTGSTIATELLEDNLPAEAYGSNPLTIVAGEGKSLAEPENREAIAATVKRLEALPEVSGLVSPLSPEGKTLNSRDGRTAYIPVYLNVSPGELSEDEAQAVLDTAEPAEAAGLEASIGSYVGSQLSQPSTELSEVVGLGAAVIVLLFSFGTATAMGLPIISAILGLASSLSILRLLEGAIQVPEHRHDAGDDDRARRRDRLRPVHRHPPQTPARRRDRAARVDRAARSPPRAAPSPSPASRSSSRSARWRSPVSTWSAPSASPRRSPSSPRSAPRSPCCRRCSGRSAPGSTRSVGGEGRPAGTSSRMAGGAGRPGRRPPAPLRDDRAGGAAGAGDPAARPRAGPERRRRDADLDHLAPVLRRDQRRVRARSQRAAADRRRTRRSGGSENGAAEALGRRSAKTRTSSR